MTRITKTPAWQRCELERDHMKCIMLAPPEKLGRQWQYAIENLGEDWRCALVFSAGQADCQLREGADLLLLLPCGEKWLLLNALRARPPLAPPYILGEDAPDGPLPAAEELPGWIQGRRDALQLPALAEKHLPAVRDIASALLRSLEVPQKLRAWDFLPDMCALTVVHPPLLQDLRHVLYPLIARRHGMTAAGVERSLRLCVESTWMHGSLAAMERFFGCSVDPEKGKPTNREFLCRVQERLTLSMLRLI